MIFTRIEIDNLFCFKDTALDLTYPRKIKDSTVEYEYLDRAENFRFKRLCIISGANASGKSSFAEILCEIVNLITKGREYFDISSLLLKGQLGDQTARINVEFVYPHEKKLTFRNISYTICEGLCWFEYTDVPILTDDSIEKCRGKIQDVLNGKNVPKSRHIQINAVDEYFKKWKDLQDVLESDTQQTWAFALSGININSDVNFIDNKNDHYKSRLLTILKTFDPSITKVTASIDEETKQATEFTIHFSHGNFCRIDVTGKIDEEYCHLLSSGTYQGIVVAGFIHFLLSEMAVQKTSGTFLLDEKMSYSHSEIEKVVVNLIAQKINRYSQFFYTTHNYDILDMDFPLHSFVFLKKENDVSQFVWADTVCNKNDRSILPFVKANYFNTIPDTYLLDDLLWQE